MSTGSRLFLVAALLGAGVACDSGRHTTAGFRLPGDGNADRGKQAFVELGCNSCHAVIGTDLSRPTVQPAVPVFLGGEINKRLSDGYLVTAMINPSHQFAPQPKDQIMKAGLSRMPGYADRMTVRQMVDVVAFLQANYTVRPSMPDYVVR